MTVRTRLEPEHLARLPVFPLPGVVFFPHTLLPLHVFEPRYRRMTEFCLEEQWPLAVAMIRPGHEQEQPGNPPFEPVAGVGRIVQARRHADGRFDITLAGLGRVRLDERESEHPYRIARAAVVEDRWPDDPAAVTRLVETLRGLVEGMRGLVPGAAKVLLDQIAFERGPEATADTAAASLFVEEVARQRLLATPRVDERLDLVVARLGALIAEAVGDDAPPH